MASLTTGGSPRRGFLGLQFDPKSRLQDLEAQLLHCASGKPESLLLYWVGLCSSVIYSISWVLPSIFHQFHILY